uniref:Uncharacterized protein n=1 Tax=Rhizophagus irregularis (strain DAOM 181602 / DAOM 197198 / MUCL 43194) TaxID=747089 RepID=U9TEN6_RHIID
METILKKKEFLKKFYLATSYALSKYRNIGGKGKIRTLEAELTELIIKVCGEIAYESYERDTTHLGKNNASFERMAAADEKE